MLASSAKTLMTKSGLRLNKLLLLFNDKDIQEGNVSVAKLNRREEEEGKIFADVANSGRRSITCALMIDREASFFFFFGLDRNHIRCSRDLYDKIFDSISVSDVADYVAIPQMQHSLQRPGWYRTHTRLRSQGWNRRRSICTASSEHDSVWYRNFEGIKARKLELSSFAGERGIAQGFMLALMPEETLMEILAGLRGMIALEDISIGEAIATVSLEATLLVQPFKRSPFTEYCSDKQWKRSPW